MATTPNYVLRIATDADVRSIVDLVNRAFAIESFFKTGDRIDETQIREMLLHGQFLLLREGETLIACVYVKLRGERAYIGVLAVDPAKQKLGIGARMMCEAEDFGRRCGMQVCRYPRCERASGTAADLPKARLYRIGDGVSGCHQDRNHARALRHHVEALAV